MDNINLIIPCAGNGQRFIDAGYETFRPLIPIFGKPMIFNVINAFPDDIIIRIITDDRHKSMLTEALSARQNVELIIIPAHKKGPAWTLLQAADALPHDEACFVAYNDILWNWNFADVMHFITSKQADGVVFINTGFHPHLFKNNFSAFCKKDNDKLLAIKEKGSFTDDWMQEALSTGVYYFANTGKMLRNVQHMIDKNMMSAGEYYPSEIYNLMLALGLSVFTYETERFVHTGIPEQLEDAADWEQIIKANNKAHRVPTLITMCGSGERMKSLSAGNKSGLLIGNEKMYHYIVLKNGSSDNTFLVNDETAGLLQQEQQVINIRIRTRTQTESLKLGTRSLKDKSNLLILSSDCYGIFDAEELRRFDDYQMVLFGFTPRLIQRKQGHAHSGFSFTGPDVKEVHIKSLANNDLGLAGLYYFPDARILKELELLDCSQYPSADHFAQYLISKKFKVGFVSLRHYVHLGTPEEYNEYLFWKRFFSSCI